jgi:hypothetical protein
MPLIKIVPNEALFQETVGFRFRHMSSARSTVTSDGRGHVTRKEFRIGRSQGNLARTPDVAVVISLKLVYAPVDDTVPAQICSTSTSTSTTYKVQSSLGPLAAYADTLLPGPEMFSGIGALPELSLLQNPMM